MALWWQCRPRLCWLLPTFTEHLPHGKHLDTLSHLVPTLSCKRPLLRSLPWPSSLPCLHLTVLWRTANICLPHLSSEPLVPEAKLHSNLHLLRYNHSINIWWINKYMKDQDRRQEVTQLVRGQAKKHMSSLTKLNCKCVPLPTSLPLLRAVVTRQIVGRKKQNKTGIPRASE